MIRAGTVIEQRADRVLVSFERYDACKGCGGCMSASKKQAVIEVVGQAQVGDTVYVEMPDAQIVKASIYMYVIPLVGFLAGLFVGGALFGGRDAGAFGGAMVGLALSLGVLALLDRRLSLRSQWQPKLVDAPDGPLPVPQGCPAVKNGPGQGNTP